MTRNTLGLAVSLPALLVLGGTALAQTPPAPGAKPPAPPAAATPTPGTPGAKGGDTGPDGAAQNGMAQNGMAQNGAPQNGMSSRTPPEGMVIETPNGFYLVRPGQGAPRRLAMGPMGPMGQGGGPKQGAMAQGQDGPPEADMPMDEMASEDGGSAMPAHPAEPMRGQQPEGKGARFRIKTPSLTLGMKCPDDEPIKACIDAVSELIAKASPPAH